MMCTAAGLELGCHARDDHLSRGADDLFRRGGRGAGDLVPDDADDLVRDLPRARPLHEGHRRARPSSGLRIRAGRQPPANMSHTALPKAPYPLCHWQSSKQQSAMKWAKDTLRAALLHVRAYQ